MADSISLFRQGSRRIRACALTAFALWLGACASRRAPTPPPPIPEPVLPESRRLEEGLERSSVVPQTTLAPVRRVTSVSTSWPSAAASPTSRPISALARGGTDGAAAREVVYALAVPFPAGAVTLTAPARAVLDQLAARLNLGDSLFYLEVQGHADASGTDARNMAIALQRAQEVRDYLVVASGVPAARIAVVSLGAGQPVGDNETAEGRAANRRVVVLALR